jgi:hypothetical protein
MGQWTLHPAYAHTHINDSFFDFFHHHVVCKQFEMQPRNVVVAQTDALVPFSFQYYKRNSLGGGGEQCGGTTTTVLLCDMCKSYFWWFVRHFQCYFLARHGRRMIDLINEGKTIVGFYR